MKATKQYFPVILTLTGIVYMCTVYSEQNLTNCISDLSSCKSLEVIKIKVIEQ